MWTCRRRENGGRKFGKGRNQKEGTVGHFNATHRAGRWVGGQPGARLPGAAEICSHSLTGSPGLARRSLTRSGNRVPAAENEHGDRGAWNRGAAANEDTGGPGLRLIKGRDCRAHQPPWGSPTPPAHKRPITQNDLLHPFHLSDSWSANVTAFDFKGIGPALCGYRGGEWRGGHPRGCPMKG